jgi:hypothetical protein
MRLALRKICFLVSSTLLVEGCAANRVDMVATKVVEVKSDGKDLVLLPTPSVWTEGGITVVYGTVKRAPGASPVSSGHSHVRISLPSGISEEQWTRWWPQNIQVRYGKYKAEFPWVAPPGSGVLVWACFEHHEFNPGGNPPTILGQS